MKRINSVISDWLARVVAVVLAAFGFSCGDNEAPCMYGTPTGDFEVSGSVTDANDNPVEGAEIRVTKKDCPSTAYSEGTTKTNSDGTYIMSKEGTIPHDVWKVVCIPPDDSLEPDSTNVRVKYVKIKDKKDAWMYVGETSFEANFKLKKRNTEQ